MRPCLRILVSTGLTAGLVLLVLSSLPADPPPPPENDPGAEVQLRGPVHEGFAQPTEGKPLPGAVVPKQPPEPIAELPPEERPEGENMTWVPGYWAWDAERNDFIWVSGIYRNAPPGRRYIPGYWAQTSEGWQWVPGYWAAEQQQEQSYVPEPPATMENGPSLPSPDDNSFYVPGSWVYRESRYLWRPGYWSACRPGRLWVHAHYAWTPNGCIFVDGYWDWPLESRGLLFAPVCFHRPLWRTPGWCWRPTYVVSCGSLLDHLFLRPAHGHFYFGDYYGPRYSRHGYQPWYAPRRYEPLLSYYRWHHRGNPAWLGNLQQGYVDRAHGRLPLPPRTLAQQTALLQQPLPPRGPNRSQPPQVVAPLTNYRPPQGNLRLVKMDAPQLQQHQTAIKHMHDVVKARQKFEAAPTRPKITPRLDVPGGPTRQVESKTFKLPPAPKVVSQTVEPAVPRPPRPLVKKDDNNLNRRVGPNPPTPLPKVPAIAEPKKDPIGKPRISEPPSPSPKTTTPLPKVKTPPPLPKITPPPEVRTYPKPPLEVKTPPPLPKITPPPEVRTTPIKPPTVTPYPNPSPVVQPRTITIRPPTPRPPEVRVAPRRSPPPPPPPRKGGKQ